MTSIQETSLLLYHRAIEMSKTYWSEGNKGVAKGAYTKQREKGHKNTSPVKKPWTKELCEGKSGRSSKHFGRAVGVMRSMQDSSKSDGQGRDVSQRV